MPAPLDQLLPPERLADFCRRWGIIELAVFGSALGPDFRVAGPDPSDLDLLVQYRDDAHPSLLDEVRMQRELSEMAGRPVDLISRAGIESSRNPFRKREILSTARVLHAA